jgi:hypothetical protein
VPEFLIAILWGLAGSLIRVLISGSFVWLHKRSADDGKPGFEFGSLGVIVVGGAAGCLLWALTIYPYYAEGFGIWSSAATVLAGVGGGDALLNYFNRQYGVAASQEANQETGEIAGPQARSIENLTQQLEDCQKQAQELRDEVDRQKRGDKPDG